MVHVLSLILEHLIHEQSRYSASDRWGGTWCNREVCVEMKLNREGGTSVRWFGKNFDSFTCKEYLSLLTSVYIYAEGTFGKLSLR